MKRIQLFEEDAQDDPIVNLTPLIDVVFVLLIIFMIISPILELDRVQLAQAPLIQDKKNTSLQNRETCSIAVRADNTIWVEQKPIALSDLEHWLRNEKLRHPQAIPKLIHDSRAAFGTYQAIKNRVEASGFEEMDVILQPFSE